MSETSHTAWGDPKGSFREGNLGCAVAAADGTVGHGEGSGGWQQGTGRCPGAGGMGEGGKRVFVLYWPQERFESRRKLRQ